MSLNLLRKYSAILKPPLSTIFPAKRIVKRQLFDLDSNHSYNKLYPVYEIIYNDLSKKIPSSITSVDLLIMKKVLERFRTNTGNINKHLVDLENQLLDKSAEMGNKDAICLLSFESLINKNETAEEKNYAKNLIKELYELDHPLTIKLLGDLALKHQNYEECQKYYSEFLSLEQDTIQAGEVYRNLGIINFTKLGNLHLAKQYFYESIKYSPLSKCLESHYLLGTMFQATDPKLSKHHFELCASKSFKQAFKSLGFLELNYFNNINLAKEWFKLGVEVKDYDCLIGLFDSHFKLNELNDCKSILKSIKKVFKENQEFEEFTSSRHNELQVVMNNDRLNTTSSISQQK